MAAAAVPIFIAATVASAGASIIGGIQANNAAKREASALQEQGRLAQEESLREAQLHADDVRRFHRSQSVAFTKNGVSLAGSPLLVLDETVSRGQEEVDSIVKSGNAQQNLYNQNAQQAKNKGRAALISGFASAAGSVAQMGGSGLFKAPTNGGRTVMNPVPLKDY